MRAIREERDAALARANENETALAVARAVHQARAVLSSFVFARSPAGSGVVCARCISSRLYFVARALYVRVFCYCLQLFRVRFPASCVVRVRWEGDVLF